MPERSRDVWGQLDAPPLPIRLFAEMQEMIIASLLAVQKVMIQDKHAFEMYGYDIMVGGTTAQLAAATLACKRKARVA